MQFEHRFTLPADRDHAWAVLCRPDLVAACYPGLTLGALGARDHRATLKVKLGPHPMEYRGTLSVAERSDPRHRLRLVGRAADRRGRGEADLDLTLSLTRAGDAATEVQVSSTLSLTGRPAQLGAEAVRLVDERLVAQFAECLAARLPGIDPDAPVRPAAAATAEPAGAAGLHGPGGAARLFTDDDADGSDSRVAVLRATAGSLARHHRGRIAVGAALLAVTLGLVRRWRR